MDSIDLTGEDHCSVHHQRMRRRREDHEHEASVIVIVDDDDDDDRAQAGRGGTGGTSGNEHIASDASGRAAVKVNATAPAKKQKMKEGAAPSWQGLNGAKYVVACVRACKHM